MKRSLQLLFGLFYFASATILFVGCGGGDESVNPEFVEPAPVQEEPLPDPNAEPKLPVPKGGEF